MDSCQYSAATIDAARDSDLHRRAHAAGQRCAVRRNSQWRAALAESRLCHHPAVGNFENRCAAVAGVVFPSQGSRSKRQRLCVRRIDFADTDRADHAAARSWYVAADFFIRIFCDFFSRPVVEAARQCRHRRSRRATVRVEHDARLSAHPHPHAARPEHRSARRGLSHHPVDDCDWLRRHIGQGLAQWQPVAAGFYSRALHRFYSRGVRRGVWSSRFVVTHHFVHDRHRSRPDDRDECADDIFAVAGGRDHDDVFHLCVREHRHGHGDFAGGRRAAAAGELWWHGDFVDVHGVRHIDEYFHA